MDRPIIFSGPMVRALLDGRKTMTRRLAWRDVACPTGDGGHIIRRTGPSPWQKIQPGDRLWVREACWTESRINDGDGVRYAADGEWRVIQNTREASDAWLVMDGYGHARHPDNDTSTGQQVPSIHMPRWASRLTLTVTAVRVERLQEISLADAIAEGAPLDPEYRDTTADGSGPPMVKIGIASWQTPRAWFHLLWNSLHGSAAWEANPEVVALSFSVERRNIDARQP